ncbi:MAG: hypothetical protein JSS40_15940, partial [Proteobacteria bacterium]|nr:hypothetical protein [Pseudomonadota bacterium]
MANVQAIGMLLQYIGENIALFCGGLFAGATLYICLTERPPRTALSFADLLALSRANSGRTTAFLAVLAAVTSVTALVAALTGAGILWLAGGLMHAACFIVLLTYVRAIARQLADLHGEKEFEAEGHALLGRQT